MHKPAADNASLYRIASILAIVTIVYNVLEGAVSVYFGLDDDTLSLFGFGLDSFVEVISGVGIWHMSKRIQRQPERAPDRFEMTSLRITGTAFYLLSIGLTAGALINLYQGHKPETTLKMIIKMKWKNNEEVDSLALQYPDGPLPVFHKYWAPYPFH